MMLQSPVESFRLIALFAALTLAACGGRATESQFDAPEPVVNLGTGGTWEGGAGNEGTNDSGSAGEAGSGGANKGGAAGEAGNGDGGAGGEPFCDCDDGNPCTTDTCNLGVCNHRNNTAACEDDGDDCTTDICNDGICTHPPTGVCGVGGAGGGGGDGGIGGGGAGGVGGASSYCDGNYAALPLDVFSSFTYVNIIGESRTDYMMTVVDNPDCNSATVSTVAAPTDASTGTPGCRSFDYNPTCADASVCWGGVIFQSNNIALDDTQGNADGREGAGICIAAGATHVSFEARASVDTVIKFGSIREGLNQTEFWTAITTTWATYMIAIPIGERYNRNTSGAVNGVWNGFDIVAANDSGHTDGRVVFQIRNVVWGN